MQRLGYSLGAAARASLAAFDFLLAAFGLDGLLEDALVLVAAVVIAVVGMLAAMDSTSALTFALALVFFFPFVEDFVADLGVDLTAQTGAGARFNKRF